MPFSSAPLVAQQIDRIMHFYHPRCIDPRGGFHHYLMDDGARYNPEYRHLVASAGFVSIYARYARHTGNPEYLGWARHGIKYLEDAHYRTRTQGYAWTLDHGQVDDDTQRCVGLAAVMLAQAHAFDAGVSESRAAIYRVHELQTRRFFEPQHALYADSASHDWHTHPYRGQWANQCSVRALLAAHAATGDAAFLERASGVARAVWKHLAPMADGWVWEDYDACWRIDFDTHRERIGDADYPWGLQVGHQLAWARLLTEIASHHPQAPWWRETAGRLFNEAMQAGWDTHHGGLVRSVDFKREWLDRDKHHDVQAHGLAAAAALGEVSGESRYWRWFDKLSHYCWQHMIDHAHGGWYARLTPDNRPYSRQKSAAGKTDDAPLSACYDLLAIFARRNVSSVQLSAGDSA